jgi:uncharacterized protein (TIGR03437 family)
MRPGWWYLLATAAAAAGLTAADGVPSPEAPLINVGGVVNAASSIPAPNNFVAPGTIISIYGTGLAKTTREVRASDLDNGFLPVTLDGVSVFFGPVAAPLFYISPLQINAQVPFELQPGEWQVTVRVDSLQSSGSVVVRPYSPGLFNAFRHNDGTLVSKDAPAKPGEFILFFGTGFGPLRQPAPLTGQLAPSGQSWMVNPVQAAIGGEALAPEDIYYWGLAPGYAGLYQFNLRVPWDAPEGSLEVLVGIEGQWSQKGILLPVRH